MLTAFAMSLSLGIAAADTKLLNGAQEAIFEDITTQCSTAFNTSLACDVSVQTLSYDFDRLNFTTDDLSALCTSSCLSSLLTLESAVSSACGTYEVDFNGATISAVQVVDLFIYKYNMSCLADSTGSFCLLVEETWNVGSLNSSTHAFSSVLNIVTELCIYAKSSSGLPVSLLTDKRYRWFSYMADLYKQNISQF